MVANTSPMMSPLPTTDQCRTHIQRGNKVHTLHADNARKKNGLQRPTTNKMMNDSTLSARSPSFMTMVNPWIEVIFYYLTGIGLIITALNILANTIYVPPRKLASKQTYGMTNTQLRVKSPTTIKTSEPCPIQATQQNWDDEPQLITESNEDNCHNESTPPSRQERKHQCPQQIQPPTSKTHQSNDNEGNTLAHHSTPPTTIDFIQHGRMIVEVEAERFGRKRLLWRICYRNRDGLLFSLLLWYWIRSLTLVHIIYIATHGTSELILWFNIGRRFAKTMGLDYVHPADHSRPTQQQIYNDNTDGKPHINPQHLPLAEEIQPQRVNTLGRRQTLFKEPYKGRGRTSLNKPYKLLASKILTASKGKRKAIDRPKRYRLWKALHNPIPHNKSNFDTPMTGVAKGIKQHTIISKLWERPMHHVISQGLQVQAKQIVQHPPQTQPCNPHQPEQCNSLGRKQRHRLSIMLKPTKQRKISTAEHSKPTLTAKDINTEPQYSLRCIIKCYGGALLWGNVYQHMIEGSGWVKPKRDVIKWFTFA